MRINRNPIILFFILLLAFAKSGLSAEPLNGYPKIQKGDCVKLLKTNSKGSVDTTIKGMMMSSDENLYSIRVDEIHVDQKGFVKSVTKNGVDFELGKMVQESRDYVFPCDW